MIQPWIDPETKKEYPPLVLDTERTMIHNAVPLLHPCVANNVINQQIVSSLTVAMEQGALQMPIQSRRIIGNRLTAKDGDIDDAPKREYTPQEQAIFIETDALQIEMGNIVSKQTGAGGIIYDTAKSTQHKDRYSSVGMAIRYIAELEEERKKKLAQNRSDVCIGIVYGL